MTQVSAFVQLLLASVITLAVPALTVAGYKWVVAHAALIKSHMTAEQYAEFQGAVRVVVSAAEQSGLAGLITNTGEAKKKWALDLLQTIVASRGLNVSIQEIDAEIEDAIHLGLHQAGYDSGEGDTGGDSTPPSTPPDASPKQSPIGFAPPFATPTEVQGVPLSLSQRARAAVDAKYCAGIILRDTPNGSFTATNR